LGRTDNACVCEPKSTEKEKRISRKGAGGAKEERQALNAASSLRPFLCVFAPVRETVFFNRSIIVSS
jgi:hypothetical protein